ncbi:MAG: dockerin type I domain-containing protein [Phycisphaerae bacterium]
MFTRAAFVGFTIVLTSQSLSLAQNVYFADIFAPTLQDGSLRRLFIGEPEPVTLSAPGGGLRSLAIDSSASKIYWSDVDQFAIRRSNLDGSNVEDVITTGLVFPAAIALDTAAGKIYWGDGVENTISRANLDGTSVEPLLETPFFRGLTIDGGAGKMYWTTSLSPTRGDIRRANLDGSDVEILVSTPSGSFKPASLAIHRALGVMYWTDMALDTVHRANLDGSNSQPIRTTAPYINPRGIAVDEAFDRIYIGIEVDGESTYGLIMRLYLDGTEDQIVLEGIGLANAIELGPDAPSPCPGDVNGDRVVDLTDLATLLANFGTAEGATREQGDLDADGDVDLVDLATLLANFGTSCPV